MTSPKKPRLRILIPFFIRRWWAHWLRRWEGRVFVAPGSYGYFFERFYEWRRLPLGDSVREKYMLIRRQQGIWYWQSKYDYPVVK